MTRRIKIFILTIFVLLGVAYLYRYNPYQIEFLGHSNKMWAHRVNSLEKLKTSLKYFKGIELDLVFVEEENYLDVNHPPAKSIQLNFINYLDEIGKEQPYLWLDIKNLDKDNSHRIFELLYQTLTAKAYPVNKVLIETRFPEALTIFTKAGFMTSYYLPYGLSKMGENDLQNEIEKVTNVLENQPKIGISSSYKDYEIMNTYFPNKKKYLWIVGSFRKRNYSLIRIALDDENVIVVLSSFKTVKGER